MRSFNKNEIQKILAKAAELEMSKSLDDENDSLTEQEILDLAKESGISSSSIKAALHSVETPQFEQAFNWLRGTSKLEHIEYFDTELQSDQIAKVLRLLQTSENELGEAELQPKKLKWTNNLELELLNVSLQEENNRTSFTYSRRWTILKTLLTVLPFMVAFLTTLITVKGMGYDKFTAIGFAPFGGMIGLAAGWLYLKSKFETQKSKLKEILSQLRTVFVNDDVDENRIQIDEELSETTDTQITNNKIKS